MRTGPEVSADSIIYPGRLTPGDRLYLVDGPVHADGYDWYLGLPYEARTNEEGAPAGAWVRFGWVAATDKTGEAWIVPIRPDCPPNAGLDTLAGISGVLRLACFGDRPITLEGDVTCPDLGPPIPTPEPDWLTWNGCHLNPQGAPPYDPYGGGPHLGIQIHYPPDADRLTGELSVTGHFDDSRASQCRFFVPTEEGDLYTQDLHHLEAKLHCRARLVVDFSAAAVAGNVP